MGFEKVKVYPVAAMKKLADLHTTVARSRIFDKNIDHTGRKLKGYTPKYAELKRGDFRRRDGQRYKRYKAVSLNNEAGLHANLQLTYKTQRNFKRHGYNKSSYQLGWKGETATIIDGQKDQGRDITSGIPRKELNWARDQLVKIMDKEFKKKLKDVTITVGR